MDYKPKTRIKLACRMVEREIANNASSGGKYGAGLAAEGYAGGYRDALYDIILLLNGTVPERRDYWPETLPDSVK